MRWKFSTGGSIVIFLIFSLTFTICSSDDANGKNGDNGGVIPEPSNKPTESVPKASSSVENKHSNEKEQTEDTAVVDSSVVEESKINCSIPENKNNTSCKDDGFMKNIINKISDISLSDNSAMLYRTMIVLLGVTGIVILYFVIRAVRLRKKRSKSRKYGVITRGGGNGDLEMEPLGDGDDDDDDYTVFEMNANRK